jgi:predicted RNA-binding Zn-ribbon protein involved in translation (DUF1610 family)
MGEEEIRPDDPVTVAELHKRLLPYHLCRDQLGYVSKAEYDAAVLGLLADERRVAVAEPALREAVKEEIRHLEPGLAFLQRFAASEVRFKVDPAEAPAWRAEPPPPDEEISPSRAELSMSTAQAANGCRACAEPLPGADGVRFCPSCGADQVVPTCEACGAELAEGWRYCAFCGMLQDHDPA